jgi:hypothetical protein
MGGSQGSYPRREWVNLVMRECTLNEEGVENLVRITEVVMGQLVSMGVSATRPEEIRLLTPLVIEARQALSALAREGCPTTKLRLNQLQPPVEADRVCRVVWCGIWSHSHRDDTSVAEDRWSTQVRGND